MSNPMTVASRPCARVADADERQLAEHFALQLANAAREAALHHFEAVEERLHREGLWKAPAR